jgi:uncharacterized protein YbbK (DUF523 family)
MTEKIVAAKPFHMLSASASTQHLTDIRYHPSVIKILVSSCLLGAPVRHDVRDKKCDHAVLQRWIEQGRVVSVCPEMLGGLGTPRPPAEIVNDGSRRVMTREGTDVTSEFENGACATLDQGRAEDVRIAILKAGSPSCGSSFIYDGTFSKTAIEGEGITAALLRRNGIMVFSEDELDAAEQYVMSLENSG